MSCTFINWVYICVRKSFVFINLGLGYKIYLFKAVRPICIHVRSPLKRENVGQRPKAVASRAPLTGTPSSARMSGRGQKRWLLVLR